jgi:hypothetical protein
MSDVAEHPDKNPRAELPVPLVWRATLRDIVARLVARDFSLAQGVAHVEPVRAAVAQQIDKFIANYGETLAPLPEETWASSVYRWSKISNRWDVRLDLWSVEEGHSDLVLSVAVTEAPGGYRYALKSVLVP